MHVINCNTQYAVLLVIRSIAKPSALAVCALPPWWTPTHMSKGACVGALLLCRARRPTMISHKTGIPGASKGSGTISPAAAAPLFSAGGFGGRPVLPGPLGLPPLRSPWRGRVYQLYRRPSSSARAGTGEMLRHSWRCEG